jgi:hypothetical protein
LIKNRFDAANKTDGRIGRCAGDLGHAYQAGVAIDADDVGESASSIDADAQMRRE